MGDRTVVLVHGAWHGSWCWEQVVPQLDEAGVRSVAVDLPFTSFEDDVAAARSAIDSVGGPVVLVGHSYGGAVITEAGRHPAVEQLAYIAAFALDEGRSAADAVDETYPDDGLAERIAIADDGTVTLPRDDARRGFYDDCAPEAAEAALDRLRPIALACLMGTVGVPAWQDRPATYAVCTADLAVHPELQRRLARGCSTVVEWPTSHSPFLSQPSLVAELLAGLAR